MPKCIGRAPLDPDCRSEPVNFRLSANKYDAIYQRAKDARLELAEFLREAVTHELERGTPSRKR